MLTTVLRVTSVAKSLKTIVHRHRVPWSVWDQGEPSQYSQLYRNFGASITVSESEDQCMHWIEVERFLKHSAAVLNELKETGATLSMDVGFSVYSTRPGSFLVPASVLALIAQHSISLQASGYPCSEAGTIEPKQSPMPSLAEGQSG